MKAFIVLFVISIIFAFLTFLLWRFRNKKYQTKTATALVERITHSEGFINYYVKFDVDGETIEGRSIAYRPTIKTYTKGDYVPIEYYFTKNDWVRVIILDDELYPINNSFESVEKVLMWISIGFLIISIGSLIISFV